MARVMKEIFDVRYGKITVTWTDNDVFEIVQILNKRLIKNKTYNTLDRALNWIDNHYFSFPEDRRNRESAKSESEYFRKEQDAIREWDRQHIEW